MAIEPHQLAPNGHGHPSHGGNPNSMLGGDDDDDDRSDTDSDITELDAAEIPLYFTERGGRLFHSHGNLPYPLPVDTAEQNVSFPSWCRNAASRATLCSSMSFPIASPLFCYSGTNHLAIQRINSQHDLLRQRMGGIYVDRSRVEEALRPSISRNRRIVDLATGTGRW